MESLVPDSASVNGNNCFNWVSEGSGGGWHLNPKQTSFRWSGKEASRLWPSQKSATHCTVLPPYFYSSRSFKSECFAVMIESLFQTFTWDAVQFRTHLKKCLQTSRSVGVLGFLKTLALPCALLSGGKACTANKGPCMHVCLSFHSGGCGPLSLWASSFQEKCKACHLTKLKVK